MGKKNKHQNLVDENIESSEIAQADVEQTEMAEAVQAIPKVAEATKVEFDGWWAARSGVIPAVHKKEIIKADFKGRKVSMVSTMADFDEALKQYGVKLA